MVPTCNSYAELKEKVQQGDLHQKDASFSIVLTEGS